MLILSSLLCLLAEPALAATPGIASTLEESSKSTPKQMAEGAAEMVAEVDAAVATVAKLIESAKATKKGDAELAKCVEAKMPQLVTIQELARKTQGTLKRNLAAGKTGRAGGDFRQIAVLFAEAKAVLASAQACVSSAAGDPGKSSSSVTGGESTLVEEIDPEIDVDVPIVTTAF